MKMDKRIAAALLALALCPAAAWAQEAGLAVLGVQVKDTPSPAAQATVTPMATPAVTPTPSAPITLEEAEAAGLGERILFRGMEGEDVAAVQRRLNELGYYLGDIDGIFGLATRTAVYGFQRVHKLEKIDGKVGPETIARMFSDDVVVKPTPTPTATPTPTPSPTPTATPKPTPVPSATPDALRVPFALERMTLYVDEQPVELMLGRDETGSLLYPLCGVMAHMGYQSTYAAGSWQLICAETGEEIALMTDGQDGLSAGAMGSAGGVLFLTDETCPVYVCGQEAYVGEGLLRRLGASVLLVDGVPVIH